MTRITQQSLSASTYANLQSSLARTERLQAKLSSGKEISSPAQAPGQAANAMQLRTVMGTTEQYVRAADDGMGWLSSADTALSNVSTALQRVRQLAVAGANTGAMNAEGRAALAAEIRQIKDTVLREANTNYLGRPVFGGAVSGTVAYDATADPYVYVGDTGTVSRRVGTGVQVRVDVSGVAVFGTGASGVFGVLEQLADDLETNPAAVTGAIGLVDGALTDVLAGLADVGARVNRVETSRQINTDQVIELRLALSKVEDIDLPATIVDLKLQETSYQAALSATSRVLQPSLLDFLR